MSGTLTDIQNGVANSLGISSEMAGLILSCLILFGAGMVLALMMKKNTNPLLPVIVIVSIMGVLSGIGWMPVWVFIVALIVIAALFGGKVKKWID